MLVCYRLIGCVLIQLHVPLTNYSALLKIDDKIWTCENSWVDYSCLIPLRHTVVCLMDRFAWDLGGLQTEM